YVQNGYVPGLASVFANHYVLPILNASTYATIDTLVCRLDRPVSAHKGGTFFPWTFMDGAGANITSTTVLNQSSGAPSLLAGSGQASRILQLSGIGGW